MLNIQEADKQFLVRSLERGDVTLILGAGASRGSMNKSGGKVKLGSELAEIIADEAGLDYQGETLPIVISAARPILGDRKLVRIYENEYANIDPGSDIVGLSNYTWRRIYTWSIDDALNNGLKNKTQRLRYYNGMSDSVIESDDLVNLQVIKLHGDILNPANGFIMSESDYAEALASGKHHWYKKAAHDYIGSTPIFVGTSLSEPIFFAEVERAKRLPTEEQGRGYIITPETLSPIKKSAFESKGLIHISGTLHDLIAWLESVFPKGNTPKDILSKTRNFSSQELEGRFSSSDIEAVNSVYPRDMNRIYSRSISMDATEKNREARKFLRGFPSSWEIAASDVPVWLSPTENILSKLAESIENRERMFVITGQAGSGKTTAVMQSLIKHGREHPNIPIYELTAEVRSVRETLSVLTKLHDGIIVVYISDIFMFGDQLADDLKHFPRGKFTIVATARKGEWNEHLERRFGDIAAQHEYSRFTRSDYEPLVDRLVKFVPAPSFKALGRAEQLRKIAQSHEQLLIALREATSSQNFNDIITNEYERLPDDDTRRLLLIVGISTIARVGIDPGTAREAYKAVAQSRSFEDAEFALEGIVSRLPSGRLFARHELYVRHIIDDVVGLDIIVDCLISISSTFTKYPVPVVRNINKIQATLFRFCWNHKFVYDQCKRRNRKQDGERLYSQFEISFQLDGHFWLQYGLYLKEIGRLDDSLTMLGRSIEAYPDNPFAVHALAELELWVALRRDNYDALTKRLIDHAVQSLEELDSRESDVIDQYPLVTLANLHIENLIHHKLIDESIAFSKMYFDRLKLLEKRINSDRVLDAKARLLRYVSLRQWDIRSNIVGGKKSKKKYFNRRNRH